MNYDEKMALWLARIEAAKTELNSLPWWKPIKRQDASRNLRWALLGAALHELNKPKSPYGYPTDTSKYTGPQRVRLAIAKDRGTPWCEEHRIETWNCLGQHPEKFCADCDNLIWNCICPIAP